MMVYETFGNDATQLINVYKQSCQYPGKTICILGYNKRYMISKYKEESSKMPSEQDIITRATAVKENHDLYIIPFIWKSVGGKEVETLEDKAYNAAKGKGQLEAEEQAQKAASGEMGGYDFPYYEVRGKLMEVANEINGENNNVLFRWIDRDATNDNIGETLKEEELTKLVGKDSPQFLTGIYNWKEQPTKEQPTKSKQPIYDALNKCESELRKKWYELNKNYSLNSKSFYLPESVLIMNKQAHYKAITNLEKDTGGEKKKQDRESEKAFGENNINESVIFSELSVSKPVKSDYLGELDSLIEHKNSETRKKPGEELIKFSELCNVLKNTRQSAFDNGQWAFIKGDNYKNWDKDQPAANSEEEKAQNDFNELRKQKASKLLRILNQYKKELKNFTAKTPTAKKR